MDGVAVAITSGVSVALRMAVGATVGSNGTSGVSVGAIAVSVGAVGCNVGVSVATVGVTVENGVGVLHFDG